MEGYLVETDVIRLAINALLVKRVVVESETDEGEMCWGL